MYQLLILKRGKYDIKLEKTFPLCRYLGLPFHSIAYLLAGDIHRQQELSGDKKPRHLKTIRT